MPDQPTAAADQLLTPDGLLLGDDGVARPAWAALHPELRRYHDDEWGVPVTDERGMFEALTLEAFQAGLSWSTVLLKRRAFRAAFANFDPAAVAAFPDADVQRLLSDTGIIRNGPKIRATIGNAAATLKLRDEGGLVQFIWSFKPADSQKDQAHAVTQSPESQALAQGLRARGFKFVGPTSMYALMQAVGVLSVKGAPLPPGAA
jgi:DNA-3-methyladenine glycosylase I